LLFVVVVVVVDTVVAAVDIVVDMSAGVLAVG
jgi:hypothetical protein